MCDSLLERQVDTLWIYEKISCLCLLACSLLLLPPFPSLDTHNKHMMMPKHDVRNNIGKEYLINFLTHDDDEQGEEDEENGSRKNYKKGDSQKMAKSPESTDILP